MVFSCQIDVACLFCSRYAWLSQSLVYLLARAVLLERCGPSIAIKTKNSCDNLKTVQSGRPRFIQYQGSLWGYFWIATSERVGAEKEEVTLMGVATYVLRRLKEAQRSRIFKFCDVHSERFDCPLIMTKWQRYRFDCGLILQNKLDNDWTFVNPATPRYK